jgi:GNAT superfamily N-acetyltransferase
MALMETALETAAPESPETAKEKEELDDREAYRFGKPPELPSYDDAKGRVTDCTGIDVRPIDLRKRGDRAMFLDLADPIYAGDPNYISPLRMHFMKFLDPAKNPAFRNFDLEALVAYRGGAPVGRVIVHVDRKYNEYHQAKSGFFGFFESIDDAKVAHALLERGMAFLRSKGAEEVFGPMNLTTNHQCGLLVENFSRPPYVEETYNPSYYEGLLTAFGFGKAKDLLAWWIDVTNGLDSKNRQRVAKLADRIRKKEGFTFRHVNMKDIPREKERIFDIYLQAWQKNWGFVPLSREEFMFLASDLEMVLVPELFMFVEVAGRAVGFAGTLPNINEVLPKNGRLLPFGWWKFLTQRRNVGTGRLYTLGVIPEYRKRGLEAVMFVETVLRCQKAGLMKGEIGWTLEDNDLINRAIESMDGAIDRRYRILGMRLVD